MNMKKISIIIPVYNAGEYLEECLESVINQSYTNIEVLLIDDGSIDNSQEICKKYLNKSQIFKYYYQKNQGVSSARNNGIKNATGDYITFIDSDDFIENDYCDSLMKHMNSDVDMVVLGIDRFSDGNYYSIRNRFESGLYNSKDIKDIVVDDGTMSGFTFHSSCAILYRCEIIKNKKIFFNSQVKYNEDGLFNADYVFNCVNSLYVDYNKIIYHYRNNFSSASKTIDYLGEAYENSMEEILSALKNYEMFNVEEQIARRDFIIGFNKLQYIAKNKLGLKLFRDVLKKHQMRKNLKAILFRKITFPKKIAYILIKINFVHFLYFLLKIK